MLRTLFFLWFIGVGAVSAETDIMKDILARSGKISFDQVDEYEEKAQAGDSEAQYKLGVYYEDGYAGEKYLIARKWLEAAAEQGHSKAQLALGDLLSRGHLLYSPDYHLALSWYRKAANQKNVDAYFAIGRMYEEGKGVRADETQASTWYKKRMDVGDAASFKIRGDGYLTGMYGLRKSKSKALVAYGEACDLGIQKACNKYADLKREKERMFFLFRPFF